MPVIIPHRHCVICGKAIEADKVTCSDKCQQSLEKERKRQRNYMLLMMGGFIALLILLLMYSK
jgi:predicted nucleic acid-binding Zn ribbon protein